MRAWLGVALLLVALPATASHTVWKCSRPNGDPIYQDRPCAADTHPRGTREYDTPDRPEAIRRQREIDREMSRRNAELHRPGRVQSGRGKPGRSAPTGRAARWRACDAARMAAHRAAMDGASRKSRDRLERQAVDTCFGL